MVLIIEKLSELEKESIRRGIPIIGSEKGKILLNVIKKNNPKEILELGTANGYSGIILGSKGGRLITIELDSKIAKEAEDNFENFNIDAETIVGDGVEVVKKLVRNGRKFDLIFIDFAKKRYIEVLEECIKIIRKNGLIIADNINVDECSDFKKAVLNHDKLINVNCPFFR